MDEARPDVSRPEVAPRDTPAQTRQRLLRAAELLVVTEGVHALSVRRISNLAEVNSALVRYHFGGTDGLLHELALRNAARIADARDALLAAIGVEPDFERALDALVLPLWTHAAMNPEYRAIVVLDEIFARADPALHGEIWNLFAEGVGRNQAQLHRCQPQTPPEVLTERIRFVTAAALDLPPRRPEARIASQDDAAPGELGAGLAEYRRFAAHALRP